MYQFCLAEHNLYNIMEFSSEYCVGSEVDHLRINFTVGNGIFRNYIDFWS